MPLELLFGKPPVVNFETKIFFFCPVHSEQISNFIYGNFIYGNGVFLHTLRKTSIVIIFFPNGQIHVKNQQGKH